MISVLKHYPGHGDVSGDSHISLPVENADIQQVTNVYLPPFQSGLEAGAPVVMTSHVAFPVLDGDVRPTTLSEPTINILRDNLKFDGIILTDSMSMGALAQTGFGIPDLSVQAILAGVDMLLIPSPQ